MKRILLIEDDVGGQLLYRNRLTDLGYQVVVSSTGAMGLMEARSAPFDLFLVDIGLGTGIDGYEVCRRLKAIPEIHGVPVVLISGLVRTQEDLHRGYEVGCQSFLVKGDLMLLEDVVRAMLRIKTLQDDLALQNRLLEERNRRSQVEGARGGELEPAAGVGREARLHRPDGVLLVDGDGLVCTGDRGARDLFGQATEGRHLALLAPDSRLEAIVRNARTEANTSIRFEVPERPGRSARSLFALVYPLRPQADGAGTNLRVVLLFDAAGRRLAAEGAGAGEALTLRPLVEAAREVFRRAALLGSSAAVRELRARVARAANSDQPVLVQGPSGSGKGFVARSLHFSGARPGSFVAVACGGSDERELELELFGGGKGAQERPGAFQFAHGGTLFLQDIDRLPGRLQKRVLEALVQRQIRRQDSTTAERVDVRLVAGTRVGLERAAVEGEFSQELARRLAAETLVLTALEERAQDIDALAQHFLARFSRFEDARFSADASWVLGRYAWPDNVRELERTVQGACESAQASEIQLADLPQPLHDLFHAQPRRRSGAAPASFVHADKLDPALLKLHASPGATGSLLDAYEKGALLHALSLTRGDKLAAAKLLEVGKSTFYRKLKLHGIG
jgi:DNA-binding NtrC family response regulator